MEERERTKVCIILTHKELEYDISNNAYIQADGAIDLTAKTRANVTDIIQSGNVDRVRRMMDMAYEECRQLLFPFLKEDVKTGEYSNVPDELSSSYMLTLYLPASFGDNHAVRLKHLLHEYIVCRVLYDWTQLVAPSLSAYWLDRFTSARGDMRSSLVARTRPLRRKLMPW